jgi:death on curing protein
MQNPIFLTVEEVLAIHQDQIARYGGSMGVRDMGLVESAVSTPAASYFGEFVHKDGAAAADVFLDMNGMELVNEEPAFSDLVLAVATGTADKQAVTAFIRAHMRPLQD